MDIKSIKIEADYEAALKHIDHLMDAKPETPEGDPLRPRPQPADRTDPR